MPKIFRFFLSAPCLSRRYTASGFHRRIFIQAVLLTSDHRFSASSRVFPVIFLQFGSPSQRRDRAGFLPASLLGSLLRNTCIVCVIIIFIKLFYCFYFCYYITIYSKISFLLVYMAADTFSIYQFRQSKNTHQQTEGNPPMGMQQQYYSVFMAPVRSDTFCMPSAVHHCSSSSVTWAMAWGSMSVAVPT